MSRRKCSIIMTVVAVAYSLTFYWVIQAGAASDAHARTSAFMEWRREMMLRPRGPLNP